MQITIQPNGQETTVLLIGEMDTIATNEHADELQGVLNIADKDLLVDCSQLDYISSAGLRFFLQLKRQSASKGGSVRLLHINKNVSDIFLMSGFMNLFPISV